MRSNGFFLLLVFIFILIIFNSCEQTFVNSPEDCLNYDYSDCNTTEPTLVPLNIKLTLNDENLSVPLIIYKGKLEENNIIIIDTANSESYNVMLAPDNYYTVKARYISGNDIIYAIGGDNVKKIRNQVCDSICWTTQEGNVNVKLKK